LKTGEFISSVRAYFSGERQRNVSDPVREKSDLFQLSPHSVMCVLHPFVYELHAIKWVQYGCILLNPAEKIIIKSQKLSIEKHRNTNNRKYLCSGQTG
jgi:hypothetical protein